MWVWACVACHDTNLLRALYEEEKPASGPEQQADAGVPAPDAGVPAPDAGEPAPVVEKCPPHCPTPPPVSFERKPRANPIPAENSRPGDPGWNDGRSANEGQLDMYASLDSAQAGDTVAVKVSSSVPGPVTAEVYRLGWYGGAGARKLWSAGPFQAVVQPGCPTSPETGLVECAWSDTFTFTVGADWVSGLYLIKVKRPDGYKRFAPLVVKDDRTADLLFQPAFHTYQAYNTWGGQSLYSSITLPNGKAYQVSYDRPYKDDDGSGQVLRWEVHLARLLEREGYDVTYATNLDFERHEKLLEGIGVFLHGGHDEYWTSLQRERVDQALAGGKLSLVYLGANGAYWRVRMLSSSSGQPLRTLVCYKASVGSDPQPGSTVRFRDEPSPHPENALFGTMYDGWALIPFPLIVSDPEHWLFEGTGLTRGTQLHGLLGYEFDKVMDNGATPAGLRLSMDSPAVTAEGVPTRSQAVDRTLPSGRLIFSAGSIYWPLALSDNPELRDARVERMTLNVLERALAHRRPARALPPVTGPVPTQPAPQALWASQVEALAGQAGPGGWRDGPGAQALFSGPTGLAVLPTGQLVVADTGNHRIRLIDTDSERTVHTLAGNGLPGFRDGAGGQAMFRWPTGVGVGPDGSIYVADSDNHAIRRLEREGTGWRVTLYAGGMRQQGYRDGPALEARFKRPTALAVDAQGNVYVADQAGNRIRKVEAGTRQVTTLAGTGSAGFTDAATGAKALFNNPSALGLGPDNVLYVFDANQRLRSVSLRAPHAVRTVAGHPDTPLGFADGTGTEARFRAQLGLAVTEDGAVYLSDTANYRIRKVLPGPTPAHTGVWTIAGSGQLGTRLGRGDVADIVAPTGLALKPDGTVLAVSDSGNNVVRIIVR